MEPLAGAKLLPCPTHDHDELSSARFWTNVLPELCLGVISYLILNNNRQATCKRQHS